MKISYRSVLAAMMVVGFAVQVLNAGSAPFSTIQTTVLSETGDYVANARLYLYSKDRQEFIEVKDSSAKAHINVPAGQYRVYAALTANQSGIFEHYVSAEANLSVGPGESASVILALRKTDDHEMNVSDSVLEKIQLGPELAKYLN